jgi:hypothetical protein
VVLQRANENSRRVFDEGGERARCTYAFVILHANWNFFFSLDLFFLSSNNARKNAREHHPHGGGNVAVVKMKDCPVPTRAAVFALVRSEIRFILLLREKKSKNDFDAVVSKRTLARLFVRAFVLASGWDRCRRSLRESGNDEDDATTTYRFDDRKPSSRTERNILRVHSTDVGRNSVNFTFTFEAEGGANDDDDDKEEEEEEEEDEIKTLLVACPPEEGATIESFLADEKSKKFGEGIFELMLKEKIFDHAEPKEKECLKCKEWERRERERRENELVRGYREDPSFSGRGPPSFPRQPLHPGMGPRIDYIGPPDMGPDFGRNF